MRFPFLRAAPVAAALLPVLAMAAPLTLEHAIDRAVHRSESTRAARAGVASATQAAQAAGQLPDPMLGVSLENLPVTGPDRLSMTAESMTMKRVALSQEWVSSEKRALRTAAADAVVGREAAYAAATTAETRLQTALAYIDAYYAAAALRLTLANEARAVEAAQAARARLAAGSAAAPEVLALSSAAGLAADEVAAMRQQAAAASLNLARWTGLPADELAVPTFGDGILEQAFVDLHPAVVARKRELELARRESAVTAANRRPNWTWEVAYGQRTGYPDLVTVGVNIPLPIAQVERQDRDTASKLALADKAEAELAEAIRAAKAEYRTLAGDAARLEARIPAFDTAVVATARQRTAAATAAYGANQASLATVFDARQAELEAQRRLLDLRRDLAKDHAQLNFKPLTTEELQ